MALAEADGVVRGSIKGNFTMDEAPDANTISPDHRRALLEFAVAYPGAPCEDGEMGKGTLRLPDALLAEFRNLLLAAGSPE